MTQTTKFEFVELGEGYYGEYNPEDPDDVELLRLDYIVDGEEVESFCTSMPVTLTDEQRAAALAIVEGFAARHPQVTPRTLIELFSHMEPSWLTDGINERVLAIFAINKDKENQDT